MSEFHMKNLLLLLISIPVLPAPVDNSTVGTLIHIPNIKNTKVMFSSRSEHMIDYNRENKKT